MQCALNVPSSRLGRSCEQTSTVLVRDEQIPVYTVAADSGMRVLLGHANKNLHCTAELSRHTEPAAHIHLQCAQAIRKDHPGDGCQKVSEKLQHLVQQQNKVVHLVLKHEHIINIALLCKSMRCHTLNNHMQIVHL